LIRAAAKLTDPVDIGTANGPVGGLTRPDQTSSTDRQPLSAEGADGTSSTLDSNDSDERGYEPPSTWDRIVQRLSFDIDDDDDRIPDNMQDSDGDGLTNYHERWVSDTNPHNADTDGDGVKDGAEVTAGTNPTVPDGPGDTDGDGILDKDEIAWGYDPADPDTDDDGLKDGFEEEHGTFADNKDSDGDGIPDGEEDVDSDGLTAIEEQARGTDPHTPYTDGVDHDETGLTVDETLDQLSSDRAEFFRREAEAEAARAEAEAAADPSYRVVTEGDAQYVFEGSNLMATTKMAKGVAHVTDVETGNSIPITQVPRGAAIRLMNEEDIANANRDLHLIEDGRDELPKDDRGILKRFTDYRDGVKFEPVEKAPPGGEFERGGFDGDGEGEGDFPAFVGASGEWEPGAFEERQREASVDVDSDGTPDDVDPDSLSINKTTPDVEGANRSPASPFESDEVPLTPAGSDLGREMPISTVEEENPVGQSVDPATVFDEVRTRTPDPSGGPGESQSPGGSGDGTDLANQGDDSVYRWEDASSSGVQEDSVGGFGSIFEQTSPEETSSMGLQEDEHDEDPGTSGGGGPSSDDDMELTKVEQFDPNTGEGTTWFVDDDGNWHNEDKEPIPTGDVPEDVQEQNKTWTEQKQAAADTNKNEPDGSTSTSGTGPANSVGPNLLPDDGGGYNPGGNIDRDRGPAEDVPDDSWGFEGDVDERDGQGSDGVSTSVDPLGGEGSSKAGREAAASVGAPQNGAQPLPVDPQRWDGGTVEGRDLKSMVTSDDLAQPGPEDGQGGDHLRDNSGVDANASSGMFSTGNIDMGSDHVDVQTEGPYQDDPNFPTAARTSESESTQEAPLREVELGTALQTDQAAGGMGPQRVGNDPAAGIDDEFVGRLEMSLATTGPSDTPLTAHDEGSDTPDDDFGEGESGSVTPAKPDTASDDGFGKGDLDQSPSDSSRVPSPAGDIATVGDLGGVSTEKADVLGIPQDEPPVEVVAETAKTDTAPLPEDESSIDIEDLAGVGKADVLDMWDA
jgi:hypothetical protein